MLCVGVAVYDVSRDLGRMIVMMKHLHEEYAQHNTESTLLGFRKKISREGHFRQLIKKLMSGPFFSALSVL